MADGASGERVQVRGPATAPAVLVLHPWWGVTPAVMWWADQLSGAGRRVVVPDLFAGRTYETVEAAEAFSDVMDDQAAIAMIERCADELAAEGVPWAVMGFSMGAYFACPLATRGASAPAELVLFYGGQAPAGDIETGRVTFHLAPGDPYFTDEEVAEAEAAFESAGTEVEVFVYEGSGHWFAEHGSPA
jgi:carboxymethylenebutenolidase